MRCNIWKNGAERLTGDYMKKKREDAHKILKWKRDLKPSTEIVLLAQTQEQGLKKELEMDVPCWNPFVQDRFPEFYS